MEVSESRIYFWPPQGEVNNMVNDKRFLDIQNHCGKDRQESHYDYNAVKTFTNRHLICKIAQEIQRPTFFQNPKY